MSKLPPITHTCTYDSDGETFDHSEEVGALDIEYGTLCDKCGEPLTTPEQAVAHIYRELCE